MVGEILKLKQSLDSWGITEEAFANGNTQWHRQMESVPKGIAVLCTLSAGGSHTLVPYEVKSDLRYYYENPHTSFGVAKFNRKKADKEGWSRSEKVANLEKVFAKQLKIGKHLLGRIKDDSKKVSGLQPMEKLIARLESLDLTDFCNRLLDEIYSTIGSSKDVYIVLDVGLDGPKDKSYQGYHSLESINSRLLSVEAKDCKKGASTDGQGTDFFGKSIVGYEQKSFSVKAFHSKFFLYSRNEDNKCFMRYGLNSVEACRIGSEVRQEVTSFLSTLSARGENRLWYKYNPAEAVGASKNKDKQGERKLPKKTFLVLSSLCPKGWLMEQSPYEYMELPQWEEQLEAYNKMIRGQKELVPQIGCMVLVIQLPSQGAANICYSKFTNIDSVVEATKLWDAGIRNLPCKFVPAPGKFQVPTIRQFIRVMNLTRSFGSREDRRAGDSRLYEFNEEPFPFLTLGDAYDFFFGNKGTVRHVTGLFARHAVPVLIEGFGGLSTIPFSFNHLLPIAGLILHKNNIFKETVMNGSNEQPNELFNKWAFWLGYLCQKANSIHRVYFSSRNMNPPPVLIGHEAIRHMIKSPRQGLDMLMRKFSIYRPWAENYDNRPNEDGQKKTYVPIRQFDDALQRIYGIVPSGIPLSCSPDDRILISVGYGYRFPKRQPDNKDNENGVQTAVSNTPVLIDETSETE